MRKWFAEVQAEWARQLQEQQRQSRIQSKEPIGPANLPGGEGVTTITKIQFLEQELNRLREAMEQLEKVKQAAAAVAAAGAADAAAGADGAHRSEAGAGSGSGASEADASTQNPDDQGARTPVVGDRAHKAPLPRADREASPTRRPSLAHLAPVMQAASTKLRRVERCVAQRAGSHGVAAPDWPGRTARARARWRCIARRCAVTSRARP